jgi:formimidoylglutamate deiminase
MHLEEQPREIEDCLAATGRTPAQWCLDRLAADNRFTAIHCTHTSTESLGRLIAAGANVCACPLTEGNLGDGIRALTESSGATRATCLGSDSNARIDFIEEMRWLEYAQRLARGQRGCLADGSGGLAVPLFGCATAYGARALGLNAGSIEPGATADFASLDLDHPTLAGWREETLLDTVIFGGDAGLIKRVCVGGRWVR